MSQDLLARLTEAKSDSERAWIVTQSLLDALPAELSQMIWAAAIPHWFDGNILAALRPEFATQADELYIKIQSLSFVEVFAERGYNIHELTRKLILDHLWEENKEEFLTLSLRLSEYFQNQDTAEAKIEWLYHLAVTDTDGAGNTIDNYFIDLNNSFRYGEIETLANVLLEQVAANRVNSTIKAIVYYRKGQAEAKSYRSQAALSHYESALVLYREVGSRLGEANTLIGIGDVFQFLGRPKEALSHYESALVLYREVGSRLGEANTLVGIGDVLQFLYRLEEALSHYESALVLYREVGSRLGEATALEAISCVLQLLDRTEEALSQRENALALYREVSSRLGEATALEAIGNVLQFLDRPEETLSNYENAITLYDEIDSHLSQVVSQTLQSQWLSAYIKHRLLRLKPNVSEEDVLHYVIVSLIEAVKSGMEVRHPVTWGKLVADRYINKQYKLSRQSIIVKPRMLEFFGNVHRQELSSAFDTDDTEYLQSQIARLKERDRQIIQWRFFDNLSWSEIAVRLSSKTKPVTEQGARQRGKRALDALRSLYTENIES
ncbi:tetratricopeptide repeat protein [Calothrix sp. PCC 6303]|uniref:tetratricopeptide repeat protein n=1 Tax=Calothrix sp. PCC 6303 TaxID=1170562 RepID=UPI0002A047A9|nr:tetratricopeptide repeat protein [Calothrix sp. PCC 6303]AFZ03642.1 RNA polymerase sigma factor, sigma-70 family [Calothrix sp. PCC 6303]